MRKFLPALAAAILALAPALPAEAIQFATSSTTNKSVVIVPLRTNGMIAGPFGYTFGARLIPSASDVLGPLSTTAGVTEGPGYMGDLDLALRYKYTIADINFLGRFNPSVSPFVGWRGIAAGSTLTTTSGLASNAAGSLAYVHGPHLGVGAETELPLGFSAYANGGMTLLMGGGWNGKHLSTGGLQDTSGSISPGGMPLPLIGFGAAWQLGPVFRIAVGYDVFALPTNFRTQATTLANGQTWVRGLSVGVTLLGFSF